MRGIEHIPWLYDSLMSLFDALGLEDWRHWLVGAVTGRTLEVGCGTGRNLPLYPGEVRVVGLDPDLRSLGRARERSDAPLVCADAQDLPFRDASFDFVVSSLVFCSVPDPIRGLREIRRALKHEGRLRMLEHVRADARWEARLQDAVQPFWTWFTGGCHPNRDTEANVRSAGFEIEEEDHHTRNRWRRFSARPRTAEDVARPRTAENAARSSRTSSQREDRA